MNEPTTATVHVWWSTPAGSHLALVAHLAHLALLERLSDDERARAERLREPNSRMSYVAAHALLRDALGVELGIGPRDVEIVHDARGAPSLGGEHGSSPIRFSLTHTDGLVACALARSRDVGIDAEHRSRGGLVSELAETTLTEDERQAIEGGDEPARAAGFLRLFTRKEAYLKALGVGLAVEMSRVRLADLATEVERRFELVDLALSEAHQVALAVELRRGETLRVVSHRA